MSSPSPQPQSPAPVPPRWKDSNIGAQAIQSTNANPATAAPVPVPAPELSEAAKQTQKYGAANTSYGRTSTRTQTSGVTYDNELGLEDGTTDTLVRHDKVGQGFNSRTVTSGRGNDGAIITTSTNRNALLGAESKLEAIARCSDDELHAAVQMLARAGAFGEATKAASRRMGMAEVTGSASGSVGAGVQAKLRGEATIDRSGRLPQIAAAIEGAIKAGVWAEGSVEATARLSPTSFMGPIGFLVAAKIEAFAGGEAKFGADVFAGAEKGVGASIEASARAGAGAEASGEAELELGPLSFFVGAEAAAFAGAEGAFKAGFQVSLTGIKAEFEASAFAGAKASFGGKAGIKIRGREVLSVKGEVEVYAGVGAKTSTKFAAGGKLKKGGGTYSEKESESETFSSKDQDEEEEETTAKAPFEIEKDGTITFGAGLGAALGIGAGVEFEASVDFVSIGEAIITGITEISRSDDDKAYERIGPDFERTDLAADSAMAARMRKKGYSSMFPLFKDYGVQKALGGKNSVKREKVQELLDYMAPELRPYYAYRETDKGVTAAAEDAFKGQIGTIEITAGQVTKWTDLDEAQITSFKTRMQQEESWRKLRDTLRNELAAYATKKESKGEEGVKGPKIQAIISKRWEKIQEVFGNQAAELVSYAAELSRIDQYFASGKLAVDPTTGLLLEQPTSVHDAPTMVSVPNDPTATGIATALVSVKSKASKIKEDKSNAEAMKSLLGKLNTLEFDLKAYLARARRKGEFTQAGINKIFNGAVKGMDLTIPGIASVLERLVAGALAETAQDVHVRDGALVMTLVPNALNTMVDDPQTKAAEQKVLASVREYLGLKFKPDASPFKVDSLNKRIKSSTSDIADLRNRGVRDAQIKTWVETALATTGAVATVSNGTVTALDQPNFEAAKTAANAPTTTPAAAPTRNAEFDNHLRSEVMETIRKPLEKYRTEFMAAYMANSTTAAIDEARLQGIYAELSSLREDNATLVDAQFIDAVKKSFPMLPDVAVGSAGLTLGAVQLQRSDSDAAVALTADIGRSGVAVDNPAALQLLISRHIVRFQATGTTLDSLLDSTVRAAFVAAGPKSPTVSELVVESGKVKKFSLTSKGSGYSFSRFKARLFG